MSVVHVIQSEWFNVDINNTSMKEHVVDIKSVPKVKASNFKHKIIYFNNSIIVYLKYNKYNKVKGGILNEIRKYK